LNSFGSRLKKACSAWLFTLMVATVAKILPGPFDNPCGQGALGACCLLAYPRCDVFGKHLGRFVGSYKNKLLD